MLSESRDYLASLRSIWERGDYDLGYFSNPFSSDLGPEFGLRRTRALLDMLGAPDRRYPIVHVAGSKGKGSTCAFVASIAQAAGLRTGRYASPHLHSFRERIAIDGQPIDEAGFTTLLDEVDEAITRIEADRPELGVVTAFEQVTAMALLAFARQGCSLAVVEVGLGGTYDATNVIDPAVTVITRLDLEHTRVLGDTMPEIAANKAGIIKTGIPVVCAAEDLDAMQVIGAIASNRNATLYVAGRDFGWRGDWRHFTWSSGSTEIGDLRSGMAGAHQIENASLAIAATRLLNSDEWTLSADAIRHGVREASLPGRFERIMAGDRIWILDGAHTPVAAAALAQTLRSEIGHPVVTIAGFLREKHPDMFLHELAPAIESLIVTVPQHPRALPLDELVPTAHAASSQVIARQDLDTALTLARDRTAPGEPIVITGSFALVAEARERLGLALSDPQPSRDRADAHLRSIPIG